MIATRPEKLPLVFREHLNAGDLAGLLENYWKCILGNPHGGARSVEIPDAAALAG